MLRALLLCLIAMVFAGSAMAADADFDGAIASADHAFAGRAPFAVAWIPHGTNGAPPPVDPLNLLAQNYPAYPQTNTFFPLLAFFNLPWETGASDHVTGICQIPLTPGGACQSTLTSYPIVASFTNPAYNPANGCNASNVLLATTSGSELTGATNMGANGVIVISGDAGVGGNSWPEGINCDNGELALIQQQGLYMVAGGSAPTHQGHINVTSNSTYYSISSVQGLATVDNALGTIIGYESFDEPNCTASTQPLMTDAINAYHNMKAWDTTRPSYANQTGSTYQRPSIINGSGNVAVAGNLTFASPLADGNTFTNYAGDYCLYVSSGGALASPAVDQLALQASAIASEDNYTMVKSNVHGQTWLYQAVSDFAAYPNDLIYAQALTIWSMGQFKASVQPEWAYLEGANDAKTAQSTVKFNANVTGGSTSIAYNTNGCAATCGNFGPASVAGCSPGTGCSIFAGEGVTDASVNFTGSISSTTLNVTATITTPFNPIVVGSVITGTGVTSATTVTALGTGTGGVGTYTVNNSQSVGSETLTNLPNCLGTGTTLSAIGSSTTATLSQAPSCGGTNYAININSNPDGVGTNAGTVQSGCRYSLGNENINLCAPGGNRFRTTPADMNSEAWAMIIAGATGLIIFPQDDYSSGWSYGGNQGSVQPTVYAASQAAANISLEAVQYTTQVIKNYAVELLAPIQGQVTLETLNPINTSTDDIVSTSTNGSLTLTSGLATFPGEALLTKHANAWWLFAIPLRCSDPHCSGSGFNNTSGGSFTFTLTGTTATACVVNYDSNSEFDPTHDTTNASHTLTSGAFTDTLGANNDNYQVKIYKCS